MKKHIFMIIIMIVVLLPQLNVLFSPGYFPMHDDTQIARVVAMGKALKNGQFPVRWVQDLGYGYGYPIFNFYAPLPYYVGGVLYALGMPGLYATKLLFGLSIVLATVVMYIVMSRMVGSIGGLIAATSYSYMPYHAVQLYIRGALGEYWMTIFLPVLVLGVYFASTYRIKRAIITIGIGLAGIILSHTLLGFATTVFVGLLFGLILCRHVFKKKGKHLVLSIGVGAVIGLGLTAFFWIPAFTEMQYTNVSGQVSQTANFRDHFVCFSQLMYSSWGYGGSQAGCQDGLSFGLGNVFIVVSFISMFFIVLTRQSMFSVWAGVLFIGIGVFFSHSLSKILWEIIPQFAYLQYPWRFLSFVMAGQALIIGSIVTVLSNRLFRVMGGIVIIILVILFNSEKFQPKYLYPATSDSFETVQALRYTASKISDEYLPQGFITPESEDQIAKHTFPEGPNYSLKTVIDRETYKKFEIVSKVEESVKLEHAHFPGWVYIVNGQQQQLKLTGGKPIITIPNDFSTVEMRFIDTLPRAFGNLISIMFVVVLVYIYGKKTIS